MAGLKQEPGESLEHFIERVVNHWEEQGAIKDPEIGEVLAKFKATEEVKHETT